MSFTKDGKNVQRKYQNFKITIERKNQGMTYMVWENKSKESKVIKVKN